MVAMRPSVRVLASSMRIPTDLIPAVLECLPDASNTSDVRPVLAVERWLHTFGFHTLRHRDGLFMVPTPTDQPGLVVAVAPDRPVLGGYREALVRLAGMTEGVLVLGTSGLVEGGVPVPAVLLAAHSRCDYTQPDSLAGVYREYPVVSSWLGLPVPALKRDWGWVTYWGLHGGVRVQRPHSDGREPSDPFTVAGMQVTHLPGVPDNPDWEGIALLTTAGLAPASGQDTIAGDETAYLDGYTCDACGHVGWVPAGDWPTIVPGCTCTDPTPILYGINQVAVSYNPAMHTSTDVADLAVAFTDWVNGQAGGWRITPIGLPGRAEPTVMNEYSWEPIETLFAACTQTLLRPEPAIS